jgi:hypothetical protein
VATCFVTLSLKVFVHFFPISIQALSVCKRFGAPTSPTKSWYVPWCECASRFIQRRSMYPLGMWKNNWTQAKFLTDFSLAKTVSESALPSNRLGCRGRSCCFLCCLGASRFSILIGLVHHWVVARIVFAITISGGYPSRCSHMVAFLETTDPCPLRSDSLRNSSLSTGILGVNQFT